MGYGLRATKTNGYIEGHTRRTKALARSVQATIRGLQRHTAIPKVVLSEITLIVMGDYTESYYQEKSQHIADGLRCNSCEEGWQCQGRVEQQKILTSSVWATVRGLQRRIVMLKVMLGPRNGPKRTAHDKD